jgi:hypothetical protein
MEAVLGDDDDPGFSAFGGAGDLGDLTKGNDKRETVVFRGRAFREEASIAPSDDSHEDESDSEAIRSKSDESNDRVESLDLIRGVNMRCAVRGERELDGMGDMAGGGLGVIKGAETEIVKMVKDVDRR